MANKDRAAADRRQHESFWVTANRMYFKIARIKDIHLETENEGCTYRTWDTCNTENLKQLLIMVDN